MDTTAQPQAAEGPQGAPRPGELALVLHTHLPYVAGHGVWPVGEEWLFQAWAGAWLPVTRVLERHAARGRRHLLTLSVTPMVAEQVSDDRLARALSDWIAGSMWRSEEQRWHDSMGTAVTGLASFWWRHFAELLDYHAEIQARGGLCVVWDELARAEVIELLAGPATHPYLPLEPDPAIVTAQLATGLTSHRTWTRFTGGLWPPELGYRPQGQVGDPTVAPIAVSAQGTPTLHRSGPELPGLETHYAQLGITHVVVDGPTLIRAAGGAEQDWTRRPTPHPDDPGTVAEVLHAGAWIGSSGVAAFARDLTVAYHVWSPTDGYPGNAWYLDHHATGGFGVHRSWRVTDRALPPDAKEPYVPAQAQRQVTHDAQHLLTVVGERLQGRPGGLVVAAYDTELFGHWWFEGPAWLDTVLELVARTPDLITTTLAHRLLRSPPHHTLDLPESSWGFAKGHASWATTATQPIWRTLRSADEQARAALRTRRGSAAVRAQIARELALLAASDWPFMTTRGQSPGYALERVERHAARITTLCETVAAATGDPETDEMAGRAALETIGGDPVPVDPSALVVALES
jgi:1,4-alpha-glucan branching enzyme